MAVRDAFRVPRRAMRAKHLVGFSVFAILTIILASSATSVASESLVVPNDVELGPSLMIFDGPGDGLDPLRGRDADGSSGGDKDKGKKKGHRDDGGDGGGGDGTQERDCFRWSRTELEFYEKVNNARTRRDRPQLQLDPELSRVASYHSSRMKEQQRLYHTPERKLREWVTNWDILGENVGRGGSVDSLHQAFMESADHRDIVLYREFNYVGVGVREDGGQLWVTLIFEAYKNPGTTMNMQPVC